MDAGCEFNGYASDITRVWPINGKFNKAQLEIYNLVLEANKMGINVIFFINRNILNDLLQVM